MARPAVVRILGFHETETFRESSGSLRDRACCWHQRVISESELGGGSFASSGFFSRSRFFRIQLLKPNSSCANRFGIGDKNNKR